MTPVVSVLMPVLNPHPVYFPEAVQSILTQTLDHFELIIVEDPSPDSSAKLLDGFHDSRIRLIANPHRTGLLAQRNRLLSEARAELVAMLDADDVMEPDRLEKQFAYMKLHDEIAVLGSQLKIINAASQVIGSRSYPTTCEQIVRAMPRYNAIAQPAVMARKQALIHVGGYTLAFPAEDYDLWSRMLLAGYRFANHSDALVRYRISGATKSLQIRETLQLTGEVKRRYWWDRMSLVDRLRYWGEQVLFYLPAGWVTRLFALVHIRK